MFLVKFFPWSSDQTNNTIPRLPTVTSKVETGVRFIRKMSRYMTGEKEYIYTLYYGVTWIKARLLLWLCSPLLGFGRFLSFLIPYTVGRIPWAGDQPVARPLPTKRTTQTQNKRTLTSMPWVGFEPTIPAFKRAKTIHALHRAATVIGLKHHYWTVLWNVRVGR
jgi:hypothetical protein